MEAVHPEVVAVVEAVHLEVVAEVIHLVAVVAVHPEVAVAEAIHLHLLVHLLVQETIGNPLPQELMQGNLTSVASQKDTVERKPGLVESQTSNGQDWRHLMQSTFHNHPKCNQAAQKLPPVT